MNSPSFDDPGASRRHFLIGLGVVAAGTAAGIFVAPRYLRERGADAASGAAPSSFQPHAFVRISSDNSVTAIIGKSEMGQGVHTGMPMILAEELDFDPQRMKVEFAGVDPIYNHPFLQAQFTGASMSIQSTYDSLRKVGATARAMLIAAASARWKVDAAALSTDDGIVTDGSRRISYGELVDAARELPVPQDTPLKDPTQFRYIGKSQKRLDSPDKAAGRTIFGCDVKRPDMLVAMVARAPVFGGRVRSFDATAARAVAGVVDVKQVPSGVAVIAEHTWAAQRGRDALQIDWDFGAGAAVSTESIRAEWRARLREPGIVAKTAGDFASAIAAAARTIDVEYELPYLAHAPMEPLNCVVHVTDGKCEIWTGTQSQSQDALAAAEVCGLRPEQVVLHTMFLGGGFGRRASANADFVTEATHVAKGVGRPVKTLWTREDDIRGGHYRPFNLNRVHAGIDRDGRPIAYFHHTVGKPVLAQSPLGRFVIKEDGIDPTSIEGSADMPYAIPNLRVEVTNTDEVVPVMWWRSVGHTITGFVANSMLDELAALGAKDPVQLRRELLAGKPRHLAVLEKVATESGWGKPLPAGHHHGVALQESFGSIVAQVAEVSVSGSDVRVHRVTCAIDCGLAVNPDQVVAQLQSAVVFGLSAALAGEITLRDGRVEQGNFNDYPILRINEVPEINAHIVASDGPLGGVGEPGVPPIAPAVCNAIFAATGRRIRRLPISAALRA
jgi:isoquinoline 1-oxidoreductase beta subunit